jgi:cytochrome P450
MNLVLFLLAGFETTSSSLSYCFYLLSQHPGVMQKIQEEIDSHFPSDSPEVCVNFCRKT